MSGPQRTPPTWQRVLAPVVCFAGLFALLAANPAGRLYGDDAFLVWAIVRDQSFGVHFLYVLAAEAVAHLGARGGLDPFRSLQLLSAAGTAAGIVLLYLAARRRGVEQGIALVFALLVLTSSSTWFFAAVAEVHGLHLGGLGLLAWTLAGTRTDSPVRQALWIALAFGVFAGTHKSGGLMLPAVLAAYAVATPGRPGTRRLADLGLFTLGGLLSLAAMILWQRAELGSALAAQDGLELYLDAFEANWEGWDGMIGHLGTDLTAPAFATALLGFLGAGALLRRRDAWGGPVLAALLPYCAFLMLWNYEERGAYFIVLLPVLAAAFLRACAHGDAPGRLIAAAPFVLVAQVALVGCLFRPDALLELTGKLGAFALLPAALLLGLLAPRFRVLGTRGVTRMGLVLVLLQGLGAARTLAHFDRGRPDQTWAADVCAALEDRDVVIVTGFSRFYLLRLLDRPWPEPFAGTWDLEEVGPGPAVVDVGQLTTGGIPQLGALIAGGTKVHLEDRVVEVFLDNDLLGAAVQELVASFERVPVVHGSFRAHRLELHP